jgi:hypothetical protein
MNSLEFYIRTDAVFFTGLLMSVAKVVKSGVGMWLGLGKQKNIQNFGGEAFYKTSTCKTIEMQR